MVVAFLPFATSVLAGALHDGHGQRTAVVFYGIAFDATALTFNAAWQYARSHGQLQDIALMPPDCFLPQVDLCSVWCARQGRKAAPIARVARTPRQ